MSHKEEHSLESRKASSASIRSKHPDRIPVIVEKRARDQSLPDIDKVSVASQYPSLRHHRRPQLYLWLVMGGCSASASRLPTRTLHQRIVARPQKKFLVPVDLTIGQFVYVIRKRIKLAPEQAIFLFVSTGTLPPSVAALQAVYDMYKDEDGFLYMTYSGENTFGDDISELEL